MTWAAVRDAMVAAVKTASGLADSNIIWASQDLTQPSGTYVSLSLSASENPGQDGIVTTQDLTQPKGQEIKLSALGFREVTLQLEVFSDAVVSSTAAADALQIAEGIRAALALPTVRATARAVGLSFVDISGPVQYVPSVVAVNFRGRATYDIRCFVPASDASELTGYIDSVSGTATVHGGQIDPGTVPFAAP